MNATGSILSMTRSQKLAFRDRHQPATN
jgi:hypothetical protein